MPSAWITHVKSVYAKGKAKGLTYKQAMVKAKASYKRGGAVAAEASEEPKKKRRRKKKKSVKSEEEQ